MYVRALELIDFRGYARAVVEFEPGPCVVMGPNGVGKTNLIEALYYLATLSSHRVSGDAPLIRSGADRAVVRCSIVHANRELLVELSIEQGKANKARLGRSPVARTRDILGALRLVLFSPEDLRLVKGDPSERRTYLDDLLVLRQPRFAGVLADYDRVLRQRNALLRTSYLARKVTGSQKGDLATLDVWDTHLAQHGAQLLTARLDLCAALRGPLEHAYEAVSGAEGPTAGRLAHLSYAASLSPQRGVTASGTPFEGLMDVHQAELALAEALTSSRPAEIERGMTLVGPHRDDLVLTLGDLPVKGYASHGESWSYALALRLAAYHLLRADGVEPVLVLDDVFAELDADRRERLATTVKDASQVIATCAVEADIPEALRGTRYLVSEGTVRRCGGGGVA